MTEKEALFILYLVRHAHSIWTSSEQRGLSSEGLLATKRIASILARYPIAAIYSSPYPRTIQTVKPLAETINARIKTDQRLAERKISDHPIDNFHQTMLHLWQNPNYALPGGESNSIAAGRGITFVSSITAYSSSSNGTTANIVVSTHGNLLALILQHYYPGIGYEFWSRMTFPDIYILPLEVNSKGCPTLYRKDIGNLPERLWNADSIKLLTS